MLRLELVPKLFIVSWAGNSQIYCFKLIDLALIRSETTVDLTLTRARIFLLFIYKYCSSGANFGSSFTFPGKKGSLYKVSLPFQGQINMNSTVKCDFSSSVLTFHPCGFSQIYFSLQLQSVSSQVPLYLAPWTQNIPLAIKQQFWLLDLNDAGCLTPQFVYTGFVPSVHLNSRSALLELSPIHAAS